MEMRVGECGEPYVLVVHLREHGGLTRLTAPGSIASADSKKVVAIPALGSGLEYSVFQRSQHRIIESGSGKKQHIRGLTPTTATKDDNLI